MKLIRPLILILLVLFYIDSSVVYPMGSNPSVQNLNEDILQGTYNVIFYGYTYSDDPLSIAVLDIQGDAFEFQSMSHKSKYEIKNDIDPETALNEAAWHAGRHSDTIGVRTKKITDQEGRIIGYEVRPVYHMSRFGIPDIIDVHYWFEDSRVLFNVDYKWRLKKRHKHNDDYY